MQHACVCLEPLRIIPKSSPIIYIYIYIVHMRMYFAHDMQSVDTFRGSLVSPRYCAFLRLTRMTLIGSFNLQLGLPGFTLPDF